jgi:hypothetical protein
MRDARALTLVELRPGLSLCLCGSHELMYRRLAAGRVHTVDVLRAALGERRSSDRRGRLGEFDELAADLAAAFTTERRTRDRRAS